MNILIKFLFILGTTYALTFFPIGFNKEQAIVLNDAIDHWNQEGNLLQLGHSQHRIINTLVKDQHLAFTVTKSYSNYITYDIVIDIAKCVYSNVIFNCLVHEFGHALGLKHNLDSRSIMNITIFIDKNNKAVDMPKRQLALVDRCNVK